MVASPSRGRAERATVLGLLLIAGGIAAVVGRQLGVELFDTIADAGWPLFVILPGLVLLGGAVLVAPPNGLGFAIAGSIVTSVGSLLWYQEATGHWESWAYAWALIGPGAAGLALVVYGALFGMRELVARGIRMLGMAAVLFAVGLWFFETIFATGRAPLDLGAWWPAAVIFLGLVVLISGAFEGRRARDRRLTLDDEGALQ